MTRTRDSVARADFSSGAFGEISGNNEYEQITTRDIHIDDDFEIHLEDPDSYAFPDQEIYRGKFKYVNESPLGDEEASGTFQFRTGSKLFVFRKRKGSAPIHRISRVFREAYAPDIRIHEDYKPSREAIWNFVEKASWRDDIYVLNDFGEEVSFAELAKQAGVPQKNLYGEYPLVSVELALTVPWGPSVTIRYDQGHLEVSSNDDDVYEYVLQRFERDVVAYR